MRVTEWRFAPGAETGWHRHEADYVVVPLADGELLIEEPGGVARTAKLKMHVPYARRAGVEHNVINGSPFDFAFIDIEHLKALGAPSRAALFRRRLLLERRIVGVAGGAVAVECVGVPAG